MMIIDWMVRFEAFNDGESLEYGLLGCEAV
jgi:hypothetical protein